MFHTNIYKFTVLGVKGRHISIKGSIKDENKSQCVTVSATCVQQCNTSM